MSHDPPPRITASRSMSRPPSPGSSTAPVTGSVSRPGAPRALPEPVERLARALRGLLHRGDRVECPCCGGRFRGFLPGGPERRPGARCPRCSSLERHRLLWLYLRERTPLFREPLRLLLIAPERDLQRRLHALPRLFLVSGDLDSPLAQVRFDLQCLPHPDGCFDAILCSHVLEHVADAGRAMRELVRVLRPGGWAILQSPMDSSRERTFEDPGAVTPAQRLAAFGQRDHARIFGRDYPDLLRAAGFEVTLDPFVRTLGETRIARYGLDRGEAVVVCARPAGAVSHRP